MKALSKLAVATVFTFAAAVAVAQEAGHAGHAGHGAHAAHASHQLEMADGEIRKIDKETGKLTIRHGELKNIGMGPMTMAFRARDAAMLDQVKVGDKVKFAVERANGAISIVHLENVN